jgi:HSP20 family molecular chaperone IbpA
MSYFPITHRRLHDPFDRFFGDQLHLFDPWRDIDTFPTSLLSKPSSFRWINEPHRMGRSSSSSSSSSYHTTSGSNNNGNTLIPVSTTTPSALSEKFRVQLNVAGFNPETIRTRVDGRKIIVEAKQEDRKGEGDYNIRELRKTYDLPEHAGSDNRTNY